MLLAACDQIPTEQDIEGEPEVQAQANGRTTVEIATNYGTISIELFDDLTPLTVENFTQYIENGFYDNT